MVRFYRFLFPALVSGALFLLGFLWVKEEVTSAIYRDKLDALAADYAALSQHYNEAVRRSAITELEVTEDSLAVLIRTADGDIRRIPTPFDPKREIYVDYLVGDGRIWIRRIFDETTSPQDALLINPVWDQVEWGTTHLTYGKAIYRALTPGIWSIQVSGNGSLDLEPASRSRVDLLMTAPPVRAFEEIQLEVEAATDSIGPADYLRFLFGE